jgi:hypothetical protein
MRKLLLAVALLSCSSLFAQVNPYVSSVFGVNGNMGYRNPSAEGGVGLESRGVDYLFDANARLSWDRKLQTGDGHTIYASGMGYMRIGQALIGGGMSYGNLQTSLWSKDRIAPVIGSLFNLRRMRIIASYQMAGSDKLNGAREVTGGAEFFLSPRWRLVEQVSLINYYPTGQPTAGRVFGADVRGGVKYMFGNVGRRRPSVVAAAD